MGILKIAKMGHPVLSQIAAHVEDPSSSETHALILNMIDTMLDAPGIGLAAPQVHESLRILIFQIPEERLESEKHGIGLTTLINPVIHVLSEEKEEGIEGCLSVPGMAGIVPRYKYIAYTGVDLEGKLLEREAKGYHARVVQHEFDHLDGLLYPMRMNSLTSFGYVEELQKRKINKRSEVFIDG